MLFEFAPEIWVNEAWLRFYGVRLQTRMTVVRLRGGRLLVHSPTKLDHALRAALARLGRVAYVVSPNKLHHQAIGEYAAAYSEAKVFASPGLVERRPDVRFDGVLGDAPEPQWVEELDQATTAGNAFFTEVLFLHRATQTLIAADLIENIDRETSWLGRWFLKAIRGYGRPVASPEFRMYTVDVEAARTALQKIQRWDYDRIIISHGGLIARDAKAVVQAAYDNVFRKVAQRWSLTMQLLRLMAKCQ
jgi:Domain of unknown function (DUF4336)